MIGTIRKHSSWLWWLIGGLTIISFVYFFNPSQRQNNGGGQNGGGNYGSIYGHEISVATFEDAKREFFLSYWLQNGEWPDKNPSITTLQIQQQTYSYLLINQKARDLGIYVNDDAVVTAANDLLRSPALMQLFHTSQPVPPVEFLRQVLAPEGFTAADFQRSIRTRLAVDQLMNVLGLPGALITPQEAGALYDRENQEVSAQAVFFSASNYLSKVTSTPAAIAQFYTNNMAAYREPDRIQVNYVTFQASNFLAQSKAEWAKTNLEQNIEATYQKYGSSAEFAAEKTPEAIKAKIRELLIQQRALMDAGTQAKDFVTELYAMDPVKPENLAALAQKKNLTLATSAPFSENGGTEEFAAPPAVIKAAFQLNADSPYAGPIPGTEAIYVIALANQLPSSIPSFDLIRARVAQDFKTQQAIELAQQAGTNFYFSATVQLAAGKTFPQVAVAAGSTPVILPPFSLSSADVPEVGDRAELGQLKQAAFTTRPGGISRFVSTADGGFLLFVQSLLPVDAAKKTADFPQFLAEARRARQNEAFNLWINTEFAREIANKPFFQQQQKQLGGGVQ
jgi:hypothetical protein